MNLYYNEVGITCECRLAVVAVELGMRVYLELSRRGGQTSSGSSDYPRSEQQHEEDVAYWTWRARPEDPQQELG